MSSNKKGNTKPFNFDLVSSNMTFIEQFAESVVNYTSRYNTVDSILYSPENLIGKPNNFPNAGDYPFSYMLKSYGPWWNNSEAKQPHYMIQDLDPIESLDFVVVKFEFPVLVESVSVYETFNPGAIVKLWGRSAAKWHLLWKAAPQKCTETVRKFTPPIRRVCELIGQIRIEFNQTLLNHHTSLDAVLLTGYKPKTAIEFNLLLKGVMESVLSSKMVEDITEIVEEIYDDGDSISSKLPNEILLHIFQYLDLQSLSRCAQVNKRWLSVAQDSVLYSELSLKRYWHIVDDNILRLFMSKCKNTKKVDLSWCGDDENQIHPNVFLEFLQKCCRNLTHLSLDYCKFMNRASLREIGKYKDITDLRLRRCTALAEDYESLSLLRKLKALDLSCSTIKDLELIAILESNPHLKHLIIDFCYLHRLDEVIIAAGSFNPELVTWSSWQSKLLTGFAIEKLANCHKLREIDFGWCVNLSEPANCLERIASGCNDLRRLILSGWRGISDHLLLPIIRSCKQLTQLDLLGIKNVSGDICEIALASLPKLRLLDISYCDLIRRDQVVKWREEYPHVVIQRSCDNEIN